MNLKKQAKKIRDIGISNSPGGQDSRLIHANPEEEAILALLGGSGRIDPVTGLRHYDAGGLRGDSNAGNASGGYGGGSGGSGGGSGDNTGSYAGIGAKIGSVFGPVGTVAGAGIGGLIGYSSGNSGGIYGPNEMGNTRTSNNNGESGQGGSGGGNNVINGYTTGGTSSSSGSNSSSNSTFPSVYTDPVTGRLLYNAQLGSNSSNSSLSDQQLLDSLMGTNVASQNINQDVTALQSARAQAASAGGDTSWYDSELARLNGIGSSNSATNNPLLAYTDSGLSETNANNVLDNTVANQMALGQNQNAKRGLLNSTMQDATRASLGLSTAQGKIANKATAQATAYQNKLNLMSFLKNSQQQDNTLANQGNQTALELANQENQRNIANTSVSNQNSLAAQNLNYLNGLRNDNNTNAWMSALGNAAGSINWSSLFG